MCNLDSHPVTTPREKSEEAARWINEYSVSLFREHVPYGSGTLVCIGGLCGILTAHHVSDPALRVRGAGEEALTVVFAEQVHRFDIPLHTDSFKRRYDEVVVGAYHESHDSQGPDLAFIHLFDPSKLAILKSKKLFYSLDQAKVQSVRNLPYRQKPWWIWGAPAERHSIQRPSEVGEFLARVHHFCGQATFVDERSSGCFDYIRLKIDSGRNAFPADCKGMSGGGAWLARPIFDPQVGIASLNFKPPILAGVAFYESDVQNCSRTITCHGPASLYEALYHAIQRST